MRYQAFISYKHSTVSRAQAIALEKALKNYAKPLWKRPGKIFRDEKHMTPGNSLSELIRNGLEESGYLLFLANKEAAESPWCRNELNYWCRELGRKDKLILVHIGDKISLDLEKDTIIWEETDALPADLQSFLPNIPFYVDLSWTKKEQDRDLENIRYKTIINAIIAKFRGITPEEINDEDIRVFRRNQRLLYGIIAALVLFLVVAVSGFVYANQQRNEAQRSNLIAQEARQTAQNNADTAEYHRAIAEFEALNAKIQRDSATLERNRAINEALEAKYRQYVSQAKNWFYVEQDYTKAIRSLWYAKKLIPERGDREVEDLIYTIRQKPLYKKLAIKDDLGGRLRNSKASYFWLWPETDTSSLLNPNGIILAEKDPKDRHLNAYFGEGKQYILEWSRAKNKGETIRKVKVLDGKGKPMLEWLHQDKIGGFMFAQKMLLSWSENGEVMVWDLPKRKLQVTLDHESLVRLALLSPDGKQILTLEEDGYFNLWDLNGTLLLRVEHGWDLSWAVFSPNQDRILTSGGVVAKLWDIDGSHIKSARHSRGVSGIAFSSDQEYILSWSRDHVTKLWNEEEWYIIELVQGYDGKSTEMLGAVFDDQRQQILTWAGGRGSDYGSVDLWDLTGKRKAHIHFKAGVRGAAFTPDQDHFLTWSNNLRLEKGKVHIWNLEGKPIDSLMHDEMVNYAIISEDRFKVTSWLGSGHYQKWDRKGLKHTSIQEDNLKWAQFSPDQRYIISSGKSVKLWNLKGELQVEFPHGQPEGWVAFDNAQKRLITRSSREPFVKVWGIKGNLLATIPSDREIKEAHFLNHGGVIINKGYLGASFWDISAKTPKEFSTGHRTEQIIISKDRKRLVFWTEEGDISVIDSRGNIVSSFDAGIEIAGVVLSPNNQYIVSWSFFGGEIRCWDLTGNLLMDVKLKEKVYRAVFTSDSRQIISDSQDHVYSNSFLRIWDLNGNEKARIGHQDTVSELMKLPDKQNYLSISPNTFGFGSAQVKIWDLQGNVDFEWILGDYASWAAVSPDQNYIALADNVKDEKPYSAKIWNFEKGHVASIQQDHEIQGLQFTKDNKYILTWSKYGQINLWLSPSNVVNWLESTNSIQSFSKDELRLE